jgi:hypothetical protein
MQSNNAKIHQNIFNGGLNKDLNGDFVQGSEYFDAQNLTLVEENKFLALRNINGTTPVGSSIPSSSSTVVLGSIPSNYKIGDVEGVKCLTVFSATPSGYFQITVKDLETGDNYPIYQEPAPVDYFTEDRLVDAEVYPENNMDFIYFTDNYDGNGIRKLRCEIPLPFVSNSLTRAELSLMRSGAIGYVALGSVVNGGSLLCGSYQVSYQMFTPGTNKSTKFSMLSQPIQIFDDSGDLPYSSIGVSTNKKIFLNIYPSAAELASFTHFRIAVIENIYPEGTSNQIALLSDSFSVSEFLSGSYLASVPYSSNLGSSSTSIPISEIVVDLAAVDHVKTIAVRDNRLIAGNISYKDLTYINGGSIIKEHFDFSSGVGEDYERTTRFNGHYRGEVYRYAISYFDEYGNFSPPSALDMGKVTGNKFNGNIPDNASVIALANNNFTTSLSGWSQLDPGTGGNSFTWTTISGFGVANVTLSSNFSDIIYQPITYTAGTSYTIQMKAYYTREQATSGAGWESQIVYLDAGNNIISTESFTNDYGLPSRISSPDSVPVIQKKLTIPSGTVSVGFRARKSVVYSETATYVLDSVKIVNTFKDMKYPGRNELVGSDRFSILDSEHKPIVLGLRLSGVDQHPTWAKGFVILRAKRKKDVLWQSPLLPMVEHYGIGAVGNYPTMYWNGTSNVTLTGTSPQGPSVTYFPNNYFFAKSRYFPKYASSNINAGINSVLTGEAQVQYTNRMSFGLVFPPQTMYSKNSQYVFNEVHKIQSVDAALTNLYSQNYNPNPQQANAGNYLNTSLSGTVYSLRGTALYYDPNHNRPSHFRTGVLNMGGYRSFDNLSEGFSLNGSDIMRKDNLVTEGFSWAGIDGYNIQKGAVLQLQDQNNASVTIVDSNATGGSTIVFSDGTSANWDPTNKFLIFGTTGNNYVRQNTIEIVNCRAGLTDDRYGSTNSFNEYILTGTHVVFTPSELTVVQAGGSLPKTVDIWGGDCIVTRHLFKFSDTVYNLINGNKWFGQGETINTVAANWTAAFANFSSVPLSLLTQLKNCAQYVEVYLESEYNGMLNNSSIIKKETTTGARIQTNESASRTPIVYDLNYNHILQNDQKIFVPVDTAFPNVLRSKARLIYSDQKVYQGGIEGFDVFRALNFHDLGENYGGITKLAVVSDNLYALQERAVNYIGLGERVLEQTDSDQLSVRTGDVIGTVILIDTKRGCQHMKSVQNTGSTLYFVDNFNKTINSVIGDKSLGIISDQGFQSEARAIFADVYPENEISSTFDPIRREYWVADKSGEFCHVYNEAMNKWVSNYEFPTDRGVLDGAFYNQDLYLVGRIANGNLNVHKMYANAESILFGTYVVPRVQFIINPEYQFGKQFDDLLIVSSDKLDNADLVVERELSLGNQEVFALPLDVTSRGLGNYRVKILRDADGARLKGGRMKALIRWNTGEGSLPVTLTSVLTQYRPIQKHF